MTLVNSKFSKHIIFGICGALCLSLLIWYCCTYQQREFASKLYSTIQNASQGDSSNFAMSDVTNFTWDKLFIFGPYTPAEEIEKALGFSWPPAKKKYGIAWSDTFCLLVFTYKNEVVLFCEYPRGDGDFSSISSTSGITPNAAVFSVVREKDGRLVVTRRKN